MAKKYKIKVVALIENDPILGVKYGEQEIVLSEEQYNKYNEYSKVQKRNANVIRTTSTRQK